MIGSYKTKIKLKPATPVNNESPERGSLSGKGVYEGLPLPVVGDVSLLTGVAEPD